MAAVTQEVFITRHLDKKAKATPFHLHRAVFGTVPLKSWTPKMWGGACRAPSMFFQDNFFAAEISFALLGFPHQYMGAHSGDN